MFDGWVDVFGNRLAGQSATHGAHYGTDGCAHGSADRARDGSDRRTCCDARCHAAGRGTDTSSNRMRTSPTAERIPMGILLGLLFLV